MSEQLNAIQDILLQHATPAGVKASHTFVPGSRKVYGVRNPVLNRIAKQFKAGGFDLVQELWHAGAYEEKITALKMLGCIAGKDPGRAISLVQHFSTGIDNWAECDTMGMQSLKPIMRSHRKEIFALAKQYNSSGDMWQRRLSLVLVEYYTRFPDCLPEINQLVDALENDDAYYVKKAIVWIKKNISKGK